MEKWIVAVVENAIRDVKLWNIAVKNCVLTSRNRFILTYFIGQIMGFGTRASANYFINKNCVCTIFNTYFVFFECNTWRTFHVFFAGTNFSQIRRNNYWKKKKQILKHSRQRITRRVKRFTIYMDLHTRARARGSAFRQHKCSYV